jgi:hypothetical protein
LTDSSAYFSARFTPAEAREAERRFLPLTMKSRLSFGYALVPLYLRPPYRPLAGQILVVAGRA